MKISAISDCHGFLPEIEESDLLIIAGDICPVNNWFLRRIPQGARNWSWKQDIEFQLEWLNSTFKNWLSNLKVKKVISTWGNHDAIAESQESKKIFNDSKWISLLDSGCCVDGLNIWGSPWQVAFGNWPFMEEEEYLDSKWNLIPENLDILILHGPPYGYGDLVRGIHQGSPSLSEEIKKKCPKLVFFGHIHENNGEFAINNSRLFNVAIMDNKYNPVNKPLVIEI